MTGLECLREELERRGATKNQINSVVVGMVLDIVSESGNIYQRTAEAENKLRHIEKVYDGTKLELESLNRRLDKKNDEIVAQIKEAQKILDEKNDEYLEYIEAFQNALNECETSEGRDAMRIAQVFVNSVDVDTKYDNTAFIIGLSAILTSGRIGAIEELKKVNPKLFSEPRFGDKKPLRVY